MEITSENLMMRTDLLLNLRTETLLVKIKSLTDNRYNLYVGPVYDDNIRILLDRATACIPYSADLTEPAIGIY